MSIRASLIVILGFFLALLAAGISFGVNLYASRATSTSFTKNAAIQMETIEELINAYIASGSRTAQTLAELPEARKELSIQDTVGDSVAVAALIERLQALVAISPGIETAFCGYKNGFFLSWPGKDVPPASNTESADTRFQRWFSDTVWDNNPVSVTDAFISSTTKGLAVTLTAKINNDAGETIGVGGVNASLASLVDTLRDLRFGQDGYLVLFDSEGRIILDPARPDTLLQPATEQDEGLASLASMPVGTDFVTRADKEYAVFTRLLPDIRWKGSILVAKTETAVFGQNFLLVAIFIAAALFAVLFPLGYLCVLFATRPLYALMRQSTALASGDQEALQGIRRKGPDIAIIHGSLGRLAGRLILYERKAATATSSPELAAALQLVADKTAEAMSKAKKLLATTEDSHGRAATLFSEAYTLAGLAVETEDIVENSLSLAKNVEKNLQALAFGLDTTKTASFSLAGTLESIKNDITEIVDLASAVRELADQANLLAFNVSVEANSAASDQNPLMAIAEKIKALAENTTIVAGTINAVAASLEQQQSSHSQTLNKNLVSVRRSLKETAKAGEDLSRLHKSIAASTEQFRVLATALEGFAQTGSGNTEHAADALRAAEEMANLLMGINAALTTLLSPPELPEWVKTVCSSGEGYEKGLD